MDTHLAALENEMDNTRKGLWDILKKTADSETGTNSAAIDLPQPAAGPVSPEQEAETQCQPEPNLDDARELPEAKLLKQLAEMTQLLEQQTMILYAQQKLLEDLTGRQKQAGKHKGVMAKKLKNLIHKGKVFWNAL